jgi:hypothetical protein
LTPTVGARGITIDLGFAFVRSGLFSSGKLVCGQALGCDHNRLRAEGCFLITFKSRICRLFSLLGHHCRVATEPRESTRLFRSLLLLFSDMTLATGGVNIFQFENAAQTLPTFRSGFGRASRIFGCLVDYWCLLPTHI